MTLDRKRRVLEKFRLDTPKLTAWFSNVYRIDTFCSTRPKPHLHTPSLVILVRRSQPPRESSAWRVAQQLSALPVFVEGQVPYWFQGRQLYINASILGHLEIVHRSHS